MSDQPRADQLTEANRLTPQKSTGPRSIEGKVRSRNNSWKHGLTGATALLPSDDRNAYYLYVDGIVDSLRPGSLFEYEICRDVADAHWCLRRISSIESKMFILPAVVHPPPKPTPRDHFHNEGPETWESTYVPYSDEPPRASREEDLHTAARVCLDCPAAITNISLYEQRIHRGIKHSVDELRRLESEREALTKRDMPEALKHYKVQLMQDLPFDPSAHGFVFSNDEMDQALYLEILQKRADYAGDKKYNLAEYEKKKQALHRNQVHRAALVRRNHLDGLPVGLAMKRHPRLLFLLGGSAEAIQRQKMSNRRNRAEGLAVAQQHLRNPFAGIRQRDSQLVVAYFDGLSPQSRQDQNQSQSALHCRIHQRHHTRPFEESCST
jgi:hypothetical protein